MNNDPEILTNVTIEKLVSTGMGLAKADGKVVFVTDSAPDDVADIELLKSKKNYLIGRIVKLLSPSPHRITPPCPWFFVCGGCNLQHITPDLYYETLSNSLRDSLTKIGKLEPEKLNIRPFVKSPLSLFYRVKGNFKFSLEGLDKKGGFFKKFTHEVVDVKECIIMNKKINEVFWGIKNFFEELDEDVTFNVDILSLNKTAALFYFPRKMDFEKKLINSGVADYVEINVPRRRVASSKDFFFDFNGAKFLPGSFVQVNPEINAELIKFVETNADLSGPLLDLYCGNGNLTLDLARRGIEVTGIEENPKSTYFLKEEKNFRIINETAQKGIRRLAGREKFSTILLDPPREGATPELISSILKISPSKIIYVSCDAATLSRDLAFFVSGGYKIALITPFEMFPQNSHFETGVVLERLT